jgi:hypothetical protein
LAWFLRKHPFNVSFIANDRSTAAFETIGADTALPAIISDEKGE